MKYAKLSGILTAILLLCTVCLTFSAASAAAYCMLLPVPGADSGDGILTLESGQKWYRVNRFEDYSDYILTLQDEAGEQQMLAASDGNTSQFIWQYYRSNMTTSTAPRISYLSTGRFTLSYNAGTLGSYYSYNGYGDSTWEYDGSAICFRSSDTTAYLKYESGSENPFLFTENRAEASDVRIYACGETLARCITRQPCAESYVTEGSGYPAPEFSVGVADVTVDSIRWYVDDMPQSCQNLHFAADCLTGQPAGVHRIRCQIEAHDAGGLHYREASAEATFLIAKGIMPDSVLTFSDIHEEYSLIGDAIARVLRQTDGYLPALIICTGDLVYGPTADRDTQLSRYYPQIVPQFGGLDAVYVAGNHDSAEAASVMSAAAGLGAAENLPAAGGLIFDGASDAVQQNGNSSRSAKSIRTYEINFGAAIRGSGSDVQYSYADIIDNVDRFLQSAAEQYHGELILFSAHSGLHVIGMQPDSLTPYQTPLYPWQGENIYNVDLSYELARTLNRYAEQYGMDIMYIFGHDHSRGETEMLLTDGDTLISPKHYSDQSYGTQILHFTYAHAGYLSSVIGCANYSFSFIYRNGDSYSYNLLNTKAEGIRHTDIPSKYSADGQNPDAQNAVTETAPVQTQPASQQTSESAPSSGLTTPAQTQTQTTAKPAESQPQTAAPKTGADMTLLLCGIPAAAAVLLSRKRHRSRR